MFSAKTCRLNHIFSDATSCRVFSSAWFFTESAEPPCDSNNACFLRKHAIQTTFFSDAASCRVFSSACFSMESAEPPCDSENARFLLETCRLNHMTRTPAGRFLRMDFPVRRKRAGAAFRGRYFFSTGLYSRIFFWMNGTRSSIFTRSCCIESRKRTVTEPKSGLSEPSSFFSWIVS